MLGSFFIPMQKNIRHRVVTCQLSSMKFFQEKSWLKHNLASDFLFLNTFLQGNYIFQTGQTIMNL
jgi:hypothetical protein